MNSKFGYILLSFLFISIFGFLIMYLVGFLFLFIAFVVSIVGIPLLPYFVEPQYSLAVSVLYLTITCLVLYFTALTVIRAIEEQPHASDRFIAIMPPVIFVIFFVTLNTLNII